MKVFFIDKDSSLSMNLTFFHYDVYFNFQQEFDRNNEVISLLLYLLLLIIVLFRT